MLNEGSLFMDAKGIISTLFINSNILHQFEEKADNEALKFPVRVVLLDFCVYY